jgi:hypothetical protein
MIRISERDSENADIQEDILIEGRSKKKRG